MREKFNLRSIREKVFARWIGQRPRWLCRAQDWTGLTEWHPIPFLVLALTWSLVAITLFGGFYAVLWQMIFQDPPEGQEAVWNWRFSIAQLVAVTTVLGAVIALPITLNRLVLTRRQTEAAENDHANSVQGQITDRINTAVQGLGAQKEVNRIGRPVFLREVDPNHAAMGSTDSEERHTDIEWKDEPLQIPDGMHVAEEDKWQVFTQTQPNLEVRIGAIYALERIAQDSDRDHVQIMEILCAYIRQNAPAPAEDKWPELEMKDGEDEGPLESDWKERLKAFRQAQNEAKKNLKPREDIQTALTVIGRRSPKQRRLEAGRGVEAPFPFDTPCPEYHGPDEDHDPVALTAYSDNLEIWQKSLQAYDGYRLDLRGADLRGTDLSGADLKGARLTGTYLHGADLGRVHLQGADMEATRLQGAFLGLAHLQGADLEAARLQGAVLRGARLHRAHLWQTRLQEADLTRARLQGAVFGYAWLQGANLMSACLQGADLGKARLQGTNLRWARLQGADLIEAQLQGAFLAYARLDEDTDLRAATLTGAAVRALDFTDIPQIATHLEGMFGDASVTLPAGHDNRPDHWPRNVLEGKDFNEQWRRWQTDS